MTPEQIEAALVAFFKEGHCRDPDGWKVGMRAALTAAEAKAWGGDALTDIAAERRRQADVEGWTSDHDDKHDAGEMMDAAICYLHRRREERMFGSYEPSAPAAWPWDRQWWKPKTTRRDLVRAAALIAAEIERLDRLPPAPPEAG